MQRTRQYVSQTGVRHERSVISFVSTSYFITILIRGQSPHTWSVCINDVLPSSLVKNIMLQNTNRALMLFDVEGNGKYNWCIKLYICAIILKVKELSMHNYIVVCTLMPKSFFSHMDTVNTL